ncbi:MAG: hypothetical protein MZV65_35390 [Chromatiales bacterium]|nr:hypothetical protein [Chromatiales bacterium]
MAIITLVDMTKAKRLENERRRALKERSRLDGVAAAGRGENAAPGSP